MSEQWRSVADERYGGLFEVSDQLRVRPVGGDPLPSRMVGGQLLVDFAGTHHAVDVLAQAAFPPAPTPPPTPVPAPASPRSPLVPADTVIAPARKAQEEKDEDSEEPSDDDGHHAKTKRSRS